MRRPEQDDAGYPLPSRGEPAMAGRGNASGIDVTGMRRDQHLRDRSGRSSFETGVSPTLARGGDDGRRPYQTCAACTSGTITFCAVPDISIQRHVEGRRGTEFGPLKVS